MGADIGYVQTKINQNKEKIEEMEKIVNSLSLLVHNKSKIIDEEVKESRKISNEIKNINLIDLKEQVTSSVINDLSKLLKRSHEKNLLENKQKMLSWWGEINKEREKQQIEIMDNTNSQLNAISQILFKILESNNIKVDKVHLESMNTLTLSNREVQRYMKKVSKLEKNQVEEKGIKRLKKVFPAKDWKGAKEELIQERDNEIKKLEELKLTSKTPKQNKINKGRKN
jgi:prophage DNA circulation protein|tara:strand:- start:394 stop:1074 length:681 start_codon:yes stop_codon:yes gene_type:complete